MAVENGVENASTGGRLHTALLDSNLITQTNKFLYDVKIYKCGDYIQLYKYKEKHMKTDESCCLIDERKKTFEECDSTSSEPEYKKIRLDNAIRSKLNIERLIKTNQKEFLSFLTLTFEENITNIAEANKIFNIWRGRIKKIFPNFKYMCVPEYQKKRETKYSYAVVHYHLITNIPLKSSIIIPQKGKRNQYDVLYWNIGFTSAFGIDDTSKVASYMSKYMTKDIDNRLFGRRRYFYSKNLKVPKVDFWTYEEFMKFISVVDDELYSTLYKTLYYTRMRLGECLALNWNDIRDNHIDVNKTISKEHVNGKYDITTPKTKKSNRKILLDDETINILNELKLFYQKHVGFNEAWFVFGGLNPMSQTTVNRRKDEYCVIAKVKRIRIHDLRHSHATLLLSRGVPITVISKRLGHADMTMTLNTYSHLIPEDEDKAINIINDLIKNNNLNDFKRTELVEIKKTLSNKALFNHMVGKTGGLD